jgi:hypothetical protein
VALAFHLKGYLVDLKPSISPFTDLKKVILQWGKQVQNEEIFNYLFL